MRTIRRDAIHRTARANTEQVANTARQGQVGNRRVSALNGGRLPPIRDLPKPIDNATVATPTSERNVGLVPDDPTRAPISWFTEHLPDGVGLDSAPKDSFLLPFGSETLAGDMRNVVHFAQEIDKDILRASELLEKSENKPLNEKEQREVKTLLSAGKYNLEQVQRWTSVARNELAEAPKGEEFMTKMQERLADRHMDLADLMCLYDLDQAPPEQAVSRADRIDHNLVTADAALKVARGLSVPGLPEDAQQQMVAVLEDHRALLGKAKDVAIGSASKSDSAQVLSKEVWDTDFTLTKGKKAGDSIAVLHQHWDAKSAGATGSWLPLSHPKLTQGQVLQEFVNYQVKKAGVTKENRPNLKFQFKEATTRVRNERPWEPIEKQLDYKMIEGGEYTAHSTITPAKAMARHFAKDLPANGICCGDRMQYTHVPNLASTELTDASGTTLFSALRHGVLDAYDISASTLRKLPEQELHSMVKDLLIPHTAKKAVSEEIDPYAQIASESPYDEIDFDGGLSKTADGGASANPTVLTYDDGDYATIQRATPREIPPDIPPPYSEEARESTVPFSERAFASSYWESNFKLDTTSLDVEGAVTPSENLGNLRPTSDGSDLRHGQIEVSDTGSEQRVGQIVDEIRTNPAQASKYASDMRTAASAKMAEELAVAALVSDPDKFQEALDGKVVDISLSSISLLTPDHIRNLISGAKSNERAMLNRQTKALKNLGSSASLSLQVRDHSGELRTVEVNCKVRTFNFGVNAGAVGKARHIPSHVRGWDKLMGWSYSMERNNPELRALFGSPDTAALGGNVADKLAQLESKLESLGEEMEFYSDGLQDNPEFATKWVQCEKEFDVMERKIDTLDTAAAAAKKIWRKGSYNKGGDDPYKMVSRLGMVINEMGETLAFNCKSGKDRTGQLDAELKYLTALNMNPNGYHPDPGEPAHPHLRQMRSNFTLNTGNLEMQRINTGLPGFKLDLKEVPGLANFIDPGMESKYLGGSKYITS